MIKSQILKLLTRLIRKLRFLLRQSQVSSSDAKASEIQEAIPASHFEEICISSQFVKSLLCDVEVAKNQDEKEAASARYDAT